MELYKVGSRGEMVRQIQKALCGAGLKVMQDGIYGQNTKEAVIIFQMKNGLTPDGIVGAATLAKLIPSRLKKSKRRIDEIIIHCTATMEGLDFTVDKIRAWHKAQGWSDIGYHYVIYRDGNVHLGRSVDIEGAHCQAHNLHSIGIVYVGGLDRDGKTPKDTRTPQQKASLLDLLHSLRELYPDAKIHGHRDFANKACPCFDATKEYRNI